ncbi:MAG: DUF3863 domain-containing protein [Thermoguttaceae bacterium]|jgi:hypothetical protein
MDRHTETACNRREFIAATALSAATCLSTQGGTLTAALLTDGQTPVLVGNRFLTFNTVVRVNQIEVSRDRVDGSDEGNIHTPELAQLFRQSVQRGWPGGKITWAFSWQALQDPRPNYKAIRDLVAECHSRYGDEVTFIPGGYFQPMYNARQQTRQDLHEALQRVSDIVGGGYRPRSILAGFSVLVEPPPRSWYHSEMAQEFWPRWPVILEHEHYGGSKARKAWSGDLLLKSVEDYHASYMSIHWWPREELKENRATIERINRRIGYRIQLRSITWPAAITPSLPFTVETSWANAGVAPCYGGGFWALTLKDQKDGIASVLVDEGFDVRNLKVGAPEQAAVQKLRSRFTAAYRHVEPQGTHSPPMKAGRYSLFVSIGAVDGTPQIALPMAGDDGQRRYRVGTIEVADSPK